MGKLIEIVLEIDNEGNVHGLYTDYINLFSIGRVTDIRKASNIDFNDAKQMWEVSSLDGKILHTNTNREKAIEWEIEAFSPGGTHYAKSTL